MCGCDPCGCCGGRGENHLKQMAELSKNLKEGERFLAPGRRPDGSFRKPIRIRAGYVPQEEGAIYQSKGALMTSGHTCPPRHCDCKTQRHKEKASALERQSCDVLCHLSPSPQEPENKTPIQ